MNEIEENLDYILRSKREGRRIVFCCILFNDQLHKECERLYYLSNEMPASYILGEIELWKMDIQENMIFGQNQIDGYTRIQSEID